MITKVIETIIHSELLAAFFKGLLRLLGIIVFIAVFAGSMWVLNWLHSLINPLYVLYFIGSVLAFFVILWLGSLD